MSISETCTSPDEWSYILRGYLLRTLARAKAHSWPQMGCIYLCHHKRCWKNVWFFLLLQKIPNSCCHALSFPRTVTLWNKLLKECFPDNYNILSISPGPTNIYLVHIIPSYPSCHLQSQSYLDRIFPLLWGFNNNWWTLYLFYDQQLSSGWQVRFENTILHPNTNTKLHAKTCKTSWWTE